MQITNKKFRLQNGASWPSFEKFRLKGAEALSSIANGIIATLQTKTGQYRIIEESDFQAMYGLARDVDRMRGGLRVVVLAVRAAQKHPDPENLSLLAEAVAMLGDLPELPTRNSFEQLVPENFDLDEDDEVMLAPDEIERPLQSESAIDKRMD
ncbi:MULTISPECIES: hypothetical protein [unclassified Microcoleus]|uniref:hypothetical protein n=1 Tax=unclassified Microcoleus TaxID=2642155 RepID=UPI002FD25D39